MRYTIDTEFVDDGETIEFISIGIVAEDGRTFYRVTDNENTLRKASLNPWMVKNVLNQLPFVFHDTWISLDVHHKDWRSIDSRENIVRDLKAFFGSDTNISLWGWYSAYDHVVYAQLFGKMIDLPLGYPMWTNDIKQEHARLGFPRIPEQAEGAHNALEDAKWNWIALRYLEALDGPVTRVLERPESTLNGGWRQSTANPKRTRVW